MKLFAACTLVALMTLGFCQRSSTAAFNLLVNGDFEATPAETYFDGFNTDLADDVPGWEMFLGAADGSYVLVNGVGGTNVDVDMGIGPTGGGLRTAAGSRASVVPGGAYQASLTYDNYFGAAAAEFYIDWFDGGGSLLSSAGGALADPNGPFVYEPYTQQLGVAGVAPAGTASAGVRLSSGNASYNGLAADNFRFVPEPSTALLLTLATSALLGLRNRRRV
jgi:hypothetical protein